MSETKTPRPAKRKNDLSAIFPDKETEAAFDEWWKANAKRLDSFEQHPEKSKTLLFALAQFWYERVNKAWDDTIDLVHRQSELLNKIQNAIPEAFRHGEFMALLKERDKLRAHESRIIGGMLRAEQLANQKMEKHEAIEEKEKELAPKFAPHKLNKVIAKALGLETDYVRKARKEISKKNSAGS
jgi:hypothetical protein